MISNKTAPFNVDGYISSFPDDIQKLLRQLRSIILKAAPDAEEVISYQMPAYKFHGMLVYFAGCQNHIGFYPTPSAIETFKEGLASFKCSKGAIKLPLDKPLPLKLVTEIVKFRVTENLAKLNGEGKKR